MVIYLAKITYVIMSENSIKIIIFKAKSQKGTENGKQQ